MLPADEAKRKARAYQPPGAPELAARAMARLEYRIEWRAEAGYHDASIDVYEFPSDHLEWACRVLRARGYDTYYAGHSLVVGWGDTPLADRYAIHDAAATAFAILVIAATVGAAGWIVYTLVRLVIQAT